MPTSWWMPGPARRSWARPTTNAGSTPVRAWPVNFSRLEQAAGDWFRRVGPRPVTASPRKLRSAAASCLRPASIPTKGRGMPRVARRARPQSMRRVARRSAPASAAPSKGRAKSCQRPETGRAGTQANAFLRGPRRFVRLPLVLGKQQDRHSRYPSPVSAAAAAAAAAAVAAGAAATAATAAARAAAEAASGAAAPATAAATAAAATASRCGNWTQWQQYVSRVGAWGRTGTILSSVTFSFLVRNLPWHVSPCSQQTASLRARRRFFALPVRAASLTLAWQPLKPTAATRLWPPCVLWGNKGPEKTSTCQKGHRPLQRRTGSVWPGVNCRTRL